MPLIYPSLLYYQNKQIWVSHIQFEFPPVSSRGVMSRLSCWNAHSAAHRVVLKPHLLGWTLLCGTVSETKT